MKDNISVKLLICYHKPDKLFKDEILTPIHVGRAPARAKGNPALPWLEENMIGDDTGENISDKNYCYNELTATYWAYKNYESLGNPDYVGLMHYRRHFIFNQNADMGVVEYDGMDDSYLDTISYSPERVRELVKGRDIVYYKGAVDNIYKHYCENHKKRDLDLAIDIIGELFPEYLDTAKSYVAGNSGCFCNMAIFSKKMFFEYCDFLFPILEEFFCRVDMSEKRFFISERLTGIFIAKKIADGINALSLASSFVKSEYTISVAIPYRKGELFNTAVTLRSLLVNRAKMTGLDIHILDESDDELARNTFTELADGKEGVSLTCHRFGEFLKGVGAEDILGKRKLYPFTLGELLPKVGKCLYVTSDVLFMKDIEEFFRTCSTDDFRIVGAGERIDGTPILNGTSAVINLGRMRQHKVLANLCMHIDEQSDEDVLIETVCQDQVSVYPGWFWVDASKAGLIPKEGSRAELQQDALWHTMICYSESTHPSRNPQAIYSHLWWGVVGRMPVYVPFDIDADLAGEQLDRDQIVLNREHSAGMPSRKARKGDIGIIGKIKRYYKQFGLRSTIRRFFEKLRGR